MGFFPSPASPRALWADIKAFAQDRNPHQWIAAGLALVMTVGVLVMFYLDSTEPIMPKEQLIYVDSWRADRTDAEIKADQAKRQQEAVTRAKAKQKVFQDLERKLGM